MLGPDCKTCGHYAVAHFDAKWVNGQCMAHLYTCPPIPPCDCLLFVPPDPPPTEAP